MGRRALSEVSYYSDGVEELRSVCGCVFVTKMTTPSSNAKLSGSDWMEFVLDGGCLDGYVDILDGGAAVCGNAYKSLLARYAPALSQPLPLQSP